MKLLGGLLILLAFQLAGEALHRLAGVPLPGPVLGLLLLFAVLCLRGRVPAPLEHASQRLIAILPLLFLAPFAGLFFLGAPFHGQWLAFALAVIPGTFLALLFTALLMKSLPGGGERR